ncbi:MAG: RNA methyltransferase [Deltaproteobacteria bacterium]|nr:RNA methyltransferase [Deltaproteobacteria bacterium]
MRIREITSLSNPAMKKFMLVLTGRGIKKHNLAFISGPKQVSEVLQDFPSKCYGIICRGREAIDIKVPEDATIYRLSSELFKRLDLYGTGFPLLLVRVDPLKNWDDADWPTGCTLFVPFQDPSNVGAVIRTAVAFGVSRAVFLKEAAHPFHHRSVRVAGPAIFRIPLFQGPSLNELAQVKGRLLALKQGQGKNIAKYRFPRTFGLVPGLEGPGLPDNLKHLEALNIPIEPSVESLNAAMAVGIVLYEWRRGKNKKTQKAS